jgi:short-subunit dehydrogenase
MSPQRRVMITGASEGIGREFACRLADEGYAITAVARNEKRLQELMTELGADHHTYRVADLSTTEGVAAIAEDLATERYHLLINNAGFGIYGAFYNAELPKLESMMRLNCDALVALSHAFLQQAEKGDALINVSSALAFMPMPSGGTYAATKAFVTSFTESLWYEQKDRGIYVMGLCPGATSSRFHDRAGGDETNRPPAAITQTPEEVVATAMQALAERSKPTVVSGIKNKVVTNLTRMLPRKGIVKMMATFG